MPILKKNQMPRLKNKLAENKPVASEAEKKPDEAEKKTRFLGWDLSFREMRC
jgi:hypothetical protein